MECSIKIHIKQVEQLSQTHSRYQTKAKVEKCFFYVCFVILLVALIVCVRFENIEHSIPKKGLQELTRVNIMCQKRKKISLQYKMGIQCSHALQ